MKKFFGIGRNKAMEENRKQVPSIDLFKHINNAFETEKKEPHGISKPVIREENGLCFLSCFYFNYDESDISAGFICRPIKYGLFDIVTAKPVRIYNCRTRDFSKAGYDTLYDIGRNSGYRYPYNLYIRAFSILDEVRDEYIKTGRINREKYKEYFRLILSDTPRDYHSIYKELSNVLDFRFL